MSIVGAIFVAFYFACGVALAMILGKQFGPVFALAGFLSGLIVPMILWRCIAPRLGRRLRPPGRSDPPGSSA
jgi:hypothetical protein